ncbi:MAG: DUF2341 domain-containing protein, partial [Candidatus Kariarchaeaceae archaeon]
NSFSDDTVKTGSDIENYNNKGDKSHLINEESKTGGQSLSQKFKMQTWKKPGFEYRKNIIIDSTKVSGSSNLTDFPVLLDFYDPDLRTKVQSDGDDIIFTNTTGSKLDHEIELFNQTYNNTHAHLLTWVKIPSLSPTIDTELVIYYGNSTIAAQENPENVWSEYSGVWHLDESTGGSNAIKDETNNYHGTDYGSPTLNNPGIISTGVEFDGTDDYIYINDIDLTDTWTISLWANIYEFPLVSNYKTLISKYESYVIELYSNKFEANTWEAGFTNPSPLEFFNSTTNIWFHVSYVRDGSDSYFYINGVLEDSDSTTVTTTNQNNVNLIFGSFDTFSEFFKGILDEIKISTVSKSQDWIITEYNNQLDPTNFYSISYEENQSSWYQSDFMFRKTITIDNSQVDTASDLINFPVMIELFDKDLKLKTQFDGDDIIFTDQAGTKLDQEIELFDQNYNNTHAHLVAWVKLPKLHAILDTNISIYYGNSTIGNQENSEGVWDSNYEGVWHLSEDPTGTIFDSTANNHDGTAQGGMISGNQEQGKIGGSLHFDGTNDYISIPDDAVWTTGVGKQWTLQGWFNLDTYPGSNWYAIIDNIEDTYGVQLTAESGPNATSVQIEFWDNPSSYFSPDTGVSPSSWHFITVTVDFGTVDGGKFYIDGSEIGTFTSHTTPIDPSGLTLSGPSLVTNFDGLLDEIRFSTTIRSLGWTS